MADFYKVLRKTIEALPVATGQARRAVYDRARKALGNQLEAVDPPLPPSEISRQRLALEDSIRSVEDDYLEGRIITDAEKQNSQRQAELEREEAAFRAAKSSRMIQEQADDLRAVEPRNGRQERGSNGVPGGEPGMSPAFDAPVARSRQARRDAPRPRQLEEFDEAVNTARGLDEPPFDDRDDYSEEPAPARSGGRRRGSRAEPSLDADMDRERSSDRGAMRGGRRGRGRDSYRETPSLDDPYFDGADAGGYDDFDDDPMAGRGRRSRGGEPDFAIERDDYRPPRRKRRIWLWLILLLLLGLIGGGAYYAWQNQERLLPMLEDLLNYGESDVAPLDPVIGGDGQSTGPRRVDPSQQTRIAPEAGTDVAGAEAEKNDGRLIDDSGQMNPDAVESTDTSAAVGSNALPHTAILYEEGETPDSSNAFRGGVSWRLQEQAGALPVIVGRIEVPARNLAIDITIRRNQDQALSASHLIEMSFAAPPRAVGGGLQDVPTLVLKESEEAQGDVLQAVSVKVSDTLFWIALSAAAQDVQTNLDLLANRDWFDIPVRYVNNRRAIITLEKGREGTGVFAAALEAWARDG